MFYLRLNKLRINSKGEAADNASLFLLIRQFLPFDQLIWAGDTDTQPDWVHVSYRQGQNRKEVLRMRVVGGKKVYESY